MDERKRLEYLSGLVLDERRKANKVLDTVDLAATKNANDLVKYVGHLNAAYDHVLEALASPTQNTFCIWKHLATALVLSSELVGVSIWSERSQDGMAQAVWEMLAVLSNGAIDPCADCKKDSTIEEQNTTA